MTVMSIVAVGVAGAAAVGANIGILDSASGDSSAVTEEVSSSSTQVVDVYLPAENKGTQTFTVDAAGTVALIASNQGLKLDAVVPSNGWRWTLLQSSATEMLITFTDGSRSLEFVASTPGDGSIATFVSEPVAGPAPTVADEECKHEEDDEEIEVEDSAEDVIEDMECEYEGYHDDD